MIETSDFIYLKRVLKRSEKFSASHQEFLLKKYNPLIISFSKKYEFTGDFDDVYQDSFFVMLETIKYLQKNFEKINPENFTFGYYFKKRLHSTFYMRNKRKKFDLEPIEEQTNLTTNFSFEEKIIKSDYEDFLEKNLFPYLTLREKRVYLLLKDGFRIKEILKKLKIKRNIIYYDINMIVRKIDQYKLHKSYV